MASKGINKVILVGNLGQDPEIKTAANGNKIANLSIATSESWIDKNTNEKKEKTEWHRVVAFGKIADIIEKYPKKGSSVYVEGQLQTRKWQDKEGADRYSTEIVLQGFNGVFQMLGGQGESSRQHQQKEVVQHQSQKGKPTKYDQSITDEDIPF